MDPGFPVRGPGPVRGRGPPTWVLFTKDVCENERITSHRGLVDPLGGVDLQCGHFLPKMYAKMKELGPVGGACVGHAPRSANVSLC